MLLTCLMLFTTIMLFFQQSQAQMIRNPSFPPSSPYICDESTFVTIDKGPIGWSSEINSGESISFNRGDEPWNFEIGTAFDYIATPDELYDLAQQVLNDIPGGNISELNASMLIRDLPAIGFNYEYTNGGNTHYGTAVFALDDQIANSSENENVVPQTAAFIFIYEADPSYYNRYHSQIERMLNSFSSNNGQC